MKVVRTVSAIHGLWGMSIIAFIPLGVQFPRPFGSQEAFLEYMPPWVMGLLMLSAAILCRVFITDRNDNPIRALIAVLPQQLILMWSTMWGMAQMIDTALLRSGVIEEVDLHEFDARGWLALCYLCALSWYHATDVKDLWALAFRERHRNGT